MEKKPEMISSSVCAATVSVASLSVSNATHRTGPRPRPARTSGDGRQPSPELRQPEGKLPMICERCVRVEEASAE